MNLVDFDSAELPIQAGIQAVPAAVPRALADLVYAWIGRAPLDTVRDALKRAMLVAALARTAGNLSQAAQLLGVKRQAVQQMLMRYELRSWARDLRERTRCSA